MLPPPVCKLWYQRSPQPADKGAVAGQLIFDPQRYSNLLNLKLDLLCCGRHFLPGSGGACRAQAAHNRAANHFVFTSLFLLEIPFMFLIWVRRTYNSYTFKSDVMFPPERAVNYSSLRPAQISVQSISARVNKKSGKDETFYLKSFFLVF